MATKNASNHQGQVKDPEHDGRLKGHKGGEAPRAHEDGTHPDEKHAEPKKAAAKKPEAEAAPEEQAKKAPAKAHKEPAHEEPKADPKAEAKAGPDGDADLKSREYTDAQGNVHHHTKAYMESHKGG